MSEAIARIRDDLGRKLSARLEEMMQREVDLARHVLPPNEITHMLLNVTVGVNLATILVAIQAKNDTIEADELFDVVATSLDKMVRLKKSGLADVLELVGRMQAGGAR